MSTRGINSSQILSIVYLVKSQTPNRGRSTHNSTLLMHSRKSPCHFLTAVHKYGDHVQNNQSNLLPRASFHNLASSNLSICFEVKSGVPQRSRMSPEVLKLRAFRQTSAIFLTAQKKKNKTVHSSHSNLLYLA